MRGILCSFSIHPKEVGGVYTVGYRASAESCSTIENLPVLVGTAKRKSGVTDTANWIPTC
jgi:hypothetical protein